MDMIEADSIISEYPKGLYSWIGFQAETKALCIGNEIQPVIELLEENEIEVKGISIEKFLKGKSSDIDSDLFSYIFIGRSLEQVENKKELLIKCRNLLLNGGKIYLTMDNRLSIRAFIGEKDYYTGRNYDGIENYRRIKTQDDINGKQLSKIEIKNLLSEVGLEKNHFYSVFPSIQYPQLLYEERTLPSEDLGVRYFPLYESPDSIFLDERALLNDLANNGLFHIMANAYLIECTVDGILDDATQITLSMDRGRQRTLATVIRGKRVVEKIPLYKEGYAQLEQLLQHSLDLNKHGITVLEGETNGRRYQTPFIDAEIGTAYFRRLYEENVELFLKRLEEFWNTILSSSEKVVTPLRVEYTEVPWVNAEEAICLKHGYTDLVPLNCFYKEDNFIFFDQEFCFDNYPAQAIMTRAIQLIFDAIPQKRDEMTVDDVLAYFKLDKHYDYWIQMSYEFTDELRNQKQLLPFYEKHRANYETLNSNRQRMNYSVTEYHKMFIDIFRNTENRKIILFGSGNFAKKYLAIYQQDYPASYIIDNNHEKWNAQMSGVPICGPDILNTLEEGTYKVIICIKNFEGVRKQLDELGVTNYAVFDTNMEYPKKIHQANTECAKSTESPKKYHVGYMAGVYDLFHIGHLNLFKKAKEQCDYLIVGVVTDEGVKRNKKTVPFIPFEERIEIVKSCKYVDEAVEIPLDYPDTRDAYRMYHFDVQFSGSDYEDDPAWEAKKEFLNKQGADLVFFPYTQGTSSTKLKEVINKKLV